MKTIPETIVELINLLESGRERAIDLPLEGTASIWPLLLEAASGDSSVAVKTFHRLDKLNIGRGRDFLPWSREQTSRALVCALGGALESLCECGAILADPEDSSLCAECRLNGEIFNKEERPQGAG